MSKSKEKGQEASGAELWDRIKHEQCGFLVWGSHSRICSAGGLLLGSAVLVEHVDCASAPEVVPGPVGNG